VEPAESPDGFVAGPEIKMISVAEEDFGVEIVEYVAGKNAFNGCLGSDRHEDRSFDVAMRSVEHAGTGAGFGTSCLDREAKHLAADGRR
jgi:hypothetical protein